MKYILITASLLLLSGCTPPENTGNIQAAMKTSSYEEARKHLFGTQKFSKNNGSVSIIKRGARHRGDSNYVTLSVHAKNEKIESVAILAVDNKKYLRPYGIIPNTTIKPLLGYYRLHKPAQRFMGTRLTLTTISTMHILVKTDKGLYQFTKKGLFHYRTATDIESHGGAAYACRKIKPAIKPEPYIQHARSARLKNKKLHKKIRSTWILIDHPMGNENQLTGICRQEWPLRVNYINIKQGNRTVFEAWTGNINLHPLLIINLDKPDSAPININWTNTLGQQFSKQIKSRGWRKHRQ